MTELLIIGLDGATFSVIEPLCDSGYLPTLKRLVTDGACGTLESTFPPVTGPAWMALATGKNPGKTGVFDFRNLIAEDRFEFRLVNSAEMRRARPYWDYLGEAGIDVGVVNYPFLYPPYEINGIMASGLGSDPGYEFCYPREFKEELFRECGRYRIEVPWHHPKYERDPFLFVRAVFDLLEVNRKSLELLLRKSLQVLTFVISATDYAQHYMWKYIDTDHPLYRKEEAGRFAQAFAEIWRRVDGILEMALHALPPDANVFVVSDHGFGRHKSSFCTNSWLSENGYLHRRTRIATMRRLQHWAAAALLKPWPSLATRLSRSSARGGIPKITFASEIDFSHSLAFAPINSGVAGQVYLNRQATAFKDGDSDPGEVKGEIIEKLKETCDGLGLRVNIVPREEAYHGDRVNLAPDIMFEIDDFECSVGSGFDERVFRKPPRNLAHTGSHRREGILVAYGADIKTGIRVKGATICDVAPTALHLAGLHVPTDMDGRVLREIFSAGSEPARREVTYGRAEDERRKVRERILRLKTSGAV